MLIHTPLVVHFPLALWLTSTLFDVMAWRREGPLYRQAAYWLVGLGLLGAMVSVAFGWVDLVDQERQGVGPGLLLRHRVHSLVAYAATAPYLFNFVWRRRRLNRVTPALIGLSLLGAILTGATGYLSAEIRNVM